MMINFNVSLFTGDARTSQMHLMTAVRSRPYFSPVLKSKRGPLKTLFTSLRNPPRRAVIHRPDCRHLYLNVRRSANEATSPVPGGVGLRVPVATSRLELPPDLLP